VQGPQRAGPGKDRQLFVFRIELRLNRQTHVIGAPVTHRLHKSALPSSKKFLPADSDPALFFAAFHRQLALIPVNSQTRRFMCRLQNSSRPNQLTQSADQSTVLIAKYRRFWCPAPRRLPTAQWLRGTKIGFVCHATTLNQQAVHLVHMALAGRCKIAAAP